MSSSIVSIFIPFIFLLVLMPSIFPTIARPTSSSPLIEKACSDPRLSSKSNLCVRVLQSQPIIASATNMLDLSIAIMQAGISSATNTHTYIENLLKTPHGGPDSKIALQECKLSYDSVLVSFKGALSEVKNYKEYQTATYDLLVGSTDDIQRCLDNVASGKIKDRTILSGNNLVPIYGLSAYGAVDSLTR